MQTEILSVDADLPERMKATVIARGMPIDQRIQAIRYLAQNNPSGAVDVLLTGMNVRVANPGDKRKIRTEIVQGLQHIGDVQAVCALCQIANGAVRDYQIRVHCVEALGEIGHPGGLETALKFAKKKDLRNFSMRRTGVYALRKIGGQPAFRLMIQILAKDDNFLRLLNENAALGLGEHLVHEARPTLQKIAESQGNAARAHVRWALACLAADRVLPRDLRP
jgi:HEAT repeat protein